MDVDGYELASHEYLHVERDSSAAAITTFLVSGELDIGSVERLVRAVVPVAVQGAPVVLDVGRLAFIDCSGARALIEILTAIGPGGRLIIQSPSPQVRRVLRLTATDGLTGLVIA